MTLPGGEGEARLDSSHEAEGGTIASGGRVVRVAVESLGRGIGAGPLVADSLTVRWRESLRRRHSEQTGVFGVRLAPVLAAVVLLSAGGFAAASIASGGGLSLMGTIGTLGATTGALPPKVTVCHHTHSKKKPSHTITISSKALRAHLRHGDTLGSCSTAPSGSTTTTTTTTTAPGKHEGRPEDQDESQGQGQGNGHQDEGNVSSQGNGDEHGHGQGQGQGEHGNGHRHG
jgi:hypothetical protein